MRNRRAPARPPIRFLLFFLRMFLLFCYASRSLIVSFPTNRDHSFPCRSDTDLGDTKLSVLLTDEEEEGEGNWIGWRDDFATVFSESAGFRLDFISWRASRIIVSICQHVITITKHRAKKIIYRFLFLVVSCRTWHRATAFYLRLYIFRLYRAASRFPSRNWMFATVLSLHILSPFYLSPVERCTLFSNTYEMRSQASYARKFVDKNSIESFASRFDFWDLTARIRSATQNEVAIESSCIYTRTWLVYSEKFIIRI